MRALVIDDEPGIRALLDYELRSLGLTVIQCADGVAAIAALENGKFDLIVTDVKMPGASGLQVLDAAKRHAPDTEVIVITGYTAVSEAEACRRQGAFAFLYKPFDLADFGVWVNRALESRRSERELRSLS
jgi:DNA-binding NtrC family response regulator